ncbi:5-formyltetrahydrofolate cyclo-ligase [Cyclobacterium sp.]|uniref:5-formyltetrahydrofolate cyclo-ligase n=1 Tax=Cyclobacterium sp. TaxID=1966343 RepID=UPI0019A0CA17|nr:5-formyltetrahydrofolate cyclo-ligase [Cyclobacterium sp.]MBD3630706.1 5-formyltetrahydrofolate cyclo-ligase [Cyclobacterium sp.]
MEVKKALRKAFKANREALGEKEREWRSQKITIQALSFLSNFPEVQHVHLFLPIKRLYEINTVLLLHRLFDKGYQVYGSITDRSAKRLETVRFSPNTFFREDEMGIPVPEHPEYVNEELIDLVFVPLLGVDDKGNRIGYGLGFYDRFFLNLRKDVLKIGLSYFRPEVSLPKDPHDIPLNACIFPDGYEIFNQ